MSRLVLVFTLGVVLGGLGVYFYLQGVAAREYGSSFDVHSKSVEQSLADTPRGVAASGMKESSERAAVHRLAADANVDSLRALVEETAARPKSAERRLLLTTLLSRYLELAPSEAADLAFELELDAAIVAALFGLWAATDPAAALDAWYLADDPKVGQSIGLALFEALGGNEEAFSSVNTALPPRMDHDRFQEVAIELWAQTQPEAALHKTLALERRSTRIRAIGKVAEAWAQRDASAALISLSSIDDAELRRTFETSLFRSWSELAPESVLEHLIASEDKRLRSVQLVRPALREMARSNPLRALELADRLPSAAAHRARGLVLQAWAVDDVHGALAYIENLPGGQRRKELKASVALSYAAQDPAAAFAWARKQKPHAIDELQAVVGSVSRIDPAYALDLVLKLEPDEGQPSSLIMAVASRAAYSGFGEALASKLASVPTGHLKNLGMEALFGNWVAVDPESAAAWLLDNADQADSSSFREVAEWLSAEDPAVAALYLDKVPAAHRQEWITSVAAGYASADLPAALNWVNQFRGEPAYERAMVALVMQSAGENPHGAARMLETIADTEQAARGARSLAGIWVHNDPVEAAKWAEEVEGGARSSAIYEVAENWVRSDPQAAQSWVLGLPTDADRDTGLDSLLHVIAGRSMPDAALWLAFSSDAARDKVLPSIAFRVATWDMEAARTLVDKYASNDGVRGKAELYLKQAQ